MEIAIRPLSSAILLVMEHSPAPTAHTTDGSVSWKPGNTYTLPQA